MDNARLRTGHTDAHAMRTHTTLAGLLQGRIMGEQDGSGLRLDLCVVRARFLSRRARETVGPVTRKNKKKSLCV